MSALRDTTLLVLLGLITGCGSLQNGRGWGQDATLLPGWDRLRSAAVSTATSPHVWVPTGMALLLQIDHADKQLSDWAVTHTPVFGSTTTADDASDALRKYSIISFQASLIATPSGSESLDWTWSKAKGYGVQWSAIQLSAASTKWLKADVERERPDGTNDRSFPSGHTSATAVHSMLACRNIENLEIPAWGRTTLKAGVGTIPYACGWARVEAGKHYPSDVLASVAIGNFFAMFINDAFMGIDSPDDMALTVNHLTDGSFSLGFNKRF